MATELNEHGHIPGIYNYCDRWCKKCRFQLKCLLYAGMSDRNGNLIPPENTDELMEKMQKSFDDDPDVPSAWSDDDDMDFDMDIDPD